jgi:pimeloyl-ACP methyl ester carboxylesterase
LLRLAKLVSLVLLMLAVTGAAFAANGTAKPAVSGASYTGTLSDGSLWEIDLPSNWNHQLVIYAHGIVDPQAPVALPSTNDAVLQGILPVLLEEGFAVGYSSYATNGFAIKDGIYDTDQVRVSFDTIVGKPAYTYLIGVSLGSAIVTELAENNPKNYSGVLPMCGLIGGSALEVNYVGNARVLFDYYFPGVVPGTLLKTPLLPYDPTPGDPANIGQLVAYDLEVGATSTGTPTVELGTALQIEAETGTELVEGLIYAMGFDIRYLNDVLARTGGSSPYNNASTIYVGTTNNTALNKGVERVKSGYAGVEYMDAYYQPTGNIQIPMVTLHTSRDPLVPYWHEGFYLSYAASKHRTGNLVQQVVNRWGHCAFEGQEIFNSFSGLVGWVVNGTKPAGGNVTVVNVPVNQPAPKSLKIY